MLTSHSSQSSSAPPSRRASTTIIGGGGGGGGAGSEGGGGDRSKHRRRGSLEIAQEATEAIELATLEEAVQKVSDACTRCERVFEEEMNLFRFQRVGKFNSIRSNFEAGGGHKSDKEETRRPAHSKSAAPARALRK